MTVVRSDEQGLRRLDAALDANVPVVPPLPYVVAGTGAGTVNVVKGRPAEQPVGVVVLIRLPAIHCVGHVGH